jgi:hypothetical protein
MQTRTCKVSIPVFLLLSLPNDNDPRTVASKKIRIDIADRLRFSQLCLSITRDYKWNGKSLESYNKA